MSPTLCAFSRSPTATISSSDHSSPASSARGQEIYSLLRKTFPTGAVAYTLLYTSGETITVPYSQILNYVTMQQLQEYEHQSFKKGDNMETKYNLRDDMGAWNGGSDMARIERALERLKRELKKRGSGDGELTDDGGEKETESKEDDTREKRRMARERGSEQKETGRGKRRRLVDVGRNVEGEQEMELEEDGGGISGSVLGEIRPREVKAGYRRTGLGDKRPSSRGRRGTMENEDVSAKYKSPQTTASSPSAKTNRPNRTTPKSISTPSALCAHKNASSPSQKHPPGNQNKQQQSILNFYGTKTENSQPNKSSSSTTKSAPSSLFATPVKGTNHLTREMDLAKLPSHFSVPFESPDSKLMIANGNQKPEYRLKRNRTTYESPDDSTYTPGSHSGPTLVLDKSSGDELEHLPKSTPSSKSGSESAKQLRHEMRKSLSQQGPFSSPLPHSASSSSAKKPKSNAPAKGKQNKYRNLTSNDHVKNKSEDEDEEDMFEVESIVGDRRHPITKEREFLVKWKGYSSKDNTWEPREHLMAVEEMLRQYELEKVCSSGKS